MARRLVRWFTYAVGFALLPLLSSLGLRHLTDTLSLEALQQSPELLFFCLMVCATALGDLSELSGRVGTDGLLRALFSVLLIGAVTSSILYGSFVYAAINSVEMTAVFQRNLLYVEFWMSGVFFLLTTAVQILIANVEKDE